MKTILWLLLILQALILLSCADEDLDPTLTQDRIINGNLKTLEELQGVAYGMYNRMTVTPYYGRNYIIYGEVRADHVYANSKDGRFVSVGQMMVSPEEVWPGDTWSAIYQVIASANVLIAQDPEAVEGNIDKVKHIIGQAYVIRALAHFDLLKLYGQQHAGGELGVPYIKSYKAKMSLPARESVTENMNNIYDDIEAGLQMMSQSLNNSSKQYVTTYAAQALKARVALYSGDWTKAKAAAGQVINSGEFQILDSAGFVQSWKTDDAVNSIFELAYNATDNNGINGLQNIYRGSYGNIEVLPSFPEIYDEGDIRRDSIIGTEIKDSIIHYRNIGKYPSMDFSDNISLIRYEEVILILAEAKMELGEPDALDFLNLIPAQRNASPYSQATKENILLERRKELAFEGFRFDDLARIGMDIPLVDSILQSHGGPAYGSYNFAFPIPAAEMNANSNMVQNRGY